MKSNGILLLVSFLLILATVVGVFFLVQKIDDSFSTEETEETTAASNSVGSSADSLSSGSSSDTGGDSSDVITESASINYYIDETNQTGYRTFNGVTYFFKVVKPDSNGNRYLTVYEGDIKSYGSYTPSIRYSNDSISWQSPWWYTSGSDRYFQEQITGGAAYLLYTTVAGCTDPRLVLEDLNQNVFLDENMFDYSLTNALG